MARRGTGDWYYTREAKTMKDNQRTDREDKGRFCIRENMDRV